MILILNINPMPQNCINIIRYSLVIRERALFWDYKLIADDGDCSHEIKDAILKER